MYCIARHVLTKTAKAIVRIAKEDVSRITIGGFYLCSICFMQMKEIELCSNCYKLSVQQPTDWFAIPCVRNCHINLLISITS